MAVFSQIMALLFLGLTVNITFFLEGSQLFAIGLVLCFLPSIALYLWIIVRGRKGYQWAMIQLVTHAITPFFALLSVFFDANGSGNRNYMYWWLTASILPELAPIVFLYLPSLRKFQQPLNVEHMTERYAVFILIVVGETVNTLMGDLPTHFWMRNEVIWEV